MKKLSAALLFYLGLASAALAQTAFTMPPPGGVTVVGVQVVTTCGVASGLVNNGVAYLAMNTSGQLCTNAAGGGAVTQGTIPWADNISQVGGVATAVGSGVMTAGSQRTALATDSPGIVTLGQTTKSASVPVAIASDQLGANTTANSLPITVGPALLGSYCMGANSGTMAAGLAGGSPVFSFRYGAANLAIIRKITAEADDITTAFVAGAAKFDLIAARSFTASDTGGTAGTLTGNNGKLRTSFATTGVSDFRVASTATLTAGTRTLDAQPLGSVEFAVPTSIDAGLLPTTNIFLAEIGQSPVVLAQNEGFVLQATVPGTGTWVFSVRVCWDEVSAF